MSRLLWWLGLMVITGCAGTFVRSDIAVFHELPATAAGGLRSSAMPLKAQEGSLEHKFYEELVKAELGKLGYVETPAEAADIIVFLEYGIDAGKQVVSSYPIIAQTGSTTGFTSGTIRNSTGRYVTYSGVTTYTPTYEVVGTGVTSQTVFTRFVRLDFLDPGELRNGKVKKVLEAKVVSAGSSGQLATIMPIMIRALFQEFPGKTGSTRQVDLPLERDRVFFEGTPPAEK